MLPADGFAAVRFVQIAQARRLLVAAHELVESLRAEGMPMYSEHRP
ncbi:hypothetical protein ABZ281_32980 [Streptomyces sp. NPDC006265]